MAEKEKKSTKQAATQDMGSGSIKKLLVQLAVPAIVAQVINLFVKSLKKRV